jgi:hypothetical protein
MDRQRLAREYAKNPYVDNPYEACYRDKRTRRCRYIRATSGQSRDGCSLNKPYKGEGPRCKSYGNPDAKRKAEIKKRTCKDPRKIKRRTSTGKLRCMLPNEQFIKEAELRRKADYVTDIVKNNIVSETFAPQHPGLFNKYENAYKSGNFNKAREYVEIINEYYDTILEQQLFNAKAQKGKFKEWANMQEADIESEFNRIGPEATVQPCRFIGTGVKNISDRIRLCRKRKDCAFNERTGRCHTNSPSYRKRREAMR